ncbi:MAG: hypothetical protein LUF04_00965, partial [Bacteroides sp.]|nr:hypothetical protein [Bacteroides sp.]
VPVLVAAYLYHFVVRGQSGLAFIYLTVIAVFFLSILSGILGTRYSHSIWLPAVINCVVVFIAAILLAQEGVLMIIPPMFLVTFLCSFFTWLIMHSSSGAVLYYTYILLFVLLLGGGIYTFLAFVNGPVSRGDSSIFFRTEETSAGYEQVPPSWEQHEAYLECVRLSGAGKEIEEKFSSISSSTLLVDKDGVPYSGKVYLYRPKLKINPLPRKKEVLLYYMDGLLWGYSHGQTHLPTEYTNKALLHLPGMPASLPYLIHKTYEQRALEALSWAGAYYVMPDQRLLVLGEDNSLYLGEVGFHYNGLLRYISWETRNLSDNEGMDWYRWESRFFDTLGYSGDRSDWDARAFVPVDTLPEVIRPGALKDPEEIKFMEEHFVHPVRIWLPGNTYTWKDGESLLSNLCGLYGLETGKEDLLIADARDKSLHDTRPEDRKCIGDLLNRCVIAPQLEIPHQKHLWYSDAPVWLVIREKSTGKSFSLGYIEGRFVMRNNFYTFVFPEEKQEEYTQQMQRCIRKYIETEVG